MATAEYFSISPAYIEKDYWITNTLRRLSLNTNAEKVVFKGGTSLSKAYNLVDRFSEDIDIAVIDAKSFNGNQLKTLIKKVAKDMTTDLEEIQIDGVTSKGSRFYKAVYAYPDILKPKTKSAISSGHLLVEVNSFVNPYPYEAKSITSFIEVFLNKTGNIDLIEEYNLQPFQVNVLDKRRTMIEKLLSLVRFSFSGNPVVAIASKIRHFYDLYFLAKDPECAEYLSSPDFKKDFDELYAHDQKMFAEPENWVGKTVDQSPLVRDFPALWVKLKDTYKTELSQLAFSKIPDENEISRIFAILIPMLIIDNMSYKN
ncbi:MAG: nucleotidyl transferase AbiEii/AbiGii toxin family protein [Bacteroidales bacterium]|nr:nucleotidyl transferase AbiEii/AbiGii toxin family protein [Bacteroidales bacterium]